MTNRFDVIVAGGGPVGAAAAVGLAGIGLQVALVEPGAAPSYRPERYDARVYAIAPASVALLTRVGVWPQIAATRAQPYVGMRIWTSTPAHPLHFDADDLTAQSAAAAPLGWIVEHSLLTSALWSAIGSVANLRPKIAVFAGTAVAVDLAEGDVAMTLADDGQTLRARLLVAADGADSILRSLAGIETQGWSYGQKGIVAQVECDVFHESLALQRFLATGPLAFLPLADGSRSIVWSADDALAVELMALDDDGFLSALNRAAQGVPGRAHAISQRIAVDLRLRQARSYAAPGIVVVGDAAHVVHPLAGQGVNLGFGDVAALIESIAAARDAGRDWSALRCLQRFERARMASALEMLAITDGLKRAFGSHLPGVRETLGFGLRLVDGVPPLRRWLAARAAIG